MSLKNTYAKQSNDLLVRSEKNLDYKCKYSKNEGAMPIFGVCKDIKQLIIFNSCRTTPASHESECSLVIDKELKKRIKLINNFEYQQFCKKSYTPAAHRIDIPNNSFLAKARDEKDFVNELTSLEVSKEEVPNSYDCEFYK